MTSFFKVLLIFMLFVASFYSVGQNPLIDSLSSALRTLKEDTNRVKTLQELSLQLRTSDLDSAVVSGKQALSLSEKLKWKKGIGFSNHIIGIFYYMMGDFTESLKYDDAALVIWKELSKSPNKAEANYGKLSIAKTSGNIANIYIDQANYPKALEYCFMALHTAEELGDKRVQAINFGNIGNIYKSQGNLNKALEYYNKALEKGKQINDPEFILNQTNNMASTYREMKDYAKALELYQKNLQMAEEYDVLQIQAGSLGNIGLIYAEQLKYDMALDNFLKALTISNELSDKRLIMFNLINLGGTYRKIGKFNESEKYLQEALSLGEKTGAISYLLNIEDNLAIIYLQMVLLISLVDHKEKNSSTKPLVNS